MDSIHARYSSIRSLIPPSVRIVAVTKGRGAQDIRSAVEAGCKDIGESKVAEAAEKFPRIGFSSTVRRHLVGHLQRNKVKEAVALFDVIQSVDSLPLAQKIANEAAAQKKKVVVYVQFNVAGLPQRSGFADEKELSEAVAKIRAMQHEFFKLEGLMGIASPPEDEEGTEDGEEGDGDGEGGGEGEGGEGDEGSRRKQALEFRRLRKLAAALRLPVLSMGMSDDYEEAVFEGSNMVRLGRALFGE